MQVLLHRLQIKVEDRFNLHFIEFYFTFPSHRFETFRLRSITDGVLRSKKEQINTFAKATHALQMRASELKTIY